MPAEDKLVDAIGELLGELPARMRGGRTRMTEQAMSALRSVVQDAIGAVTDGGDGARDAKRERRRQRRRTRPHRRAR